MPCMKSRGNLTSAQLQHVKVKVVYLTGRQVCCTSQTLLRIHSGCVLMLQDSTLEPGRAAGDRPPGMQRSSSSKSMAPSMAPQLRRGGPTGSRKDR